MFHTTRVMHLLRIFEHSNTSSFTYIVFSCVSTRSLIVPLSKYSIKSIIIADSTRRSFVVLDKIPINDSLIRSITGHPADCPKNKRNRSCIVDFGRAYAHAQCHHYVKCMRNDARKNTSGKNTRPN